MKRPMKQMMTLVALTLTILTGRTLWRDVCAVRAAALPSATVPVDCPLIPVMPAPSPLGTPGVFYFSSVGVSLSFNGYDFARFTLANGTTLPPGLSLGTSGSISGIPTTPGTFTFDIKLELFRYSDRGDVPIGCSDTGTFTIQVMTCVTTPVVANLNDSGPGSLRTAVATACPGSTVNFQAGLSGTLTLTSAELLIGQSLTIQGPGAQVLTLSGNHAFRVFYLADVPSTVTIAGLNLINGNGSGALSNGDGGAINVRNQGTTTLREISISGSSASLGGAIAFTGSSTTLNLIRSTLSGNTASNFGGGIDIRGLGILNVVNSTIVGNQAPAGDGGGISNSLGNRIAINLVNSTITNNQGGGLELSPRAFSTARNTLLSLNDGGDVLLDGGTFLSNGYNIFGTGVPAGAVQPSDQVGVNPLFELDANGKPLLANNGGATPTIKLLPGSPAIDRAGATPFNEVQLIELSGISGNYSLTFNGQTTNPLPFNATAAQIQTALNALSTIGGVGGNVSVTQAGSGGVFRSTVFFGGTLAGNDQPLISADASDGIFSLEVFPSLDGGSGLLPPADQRGLPRPVDLSTPNAGGGNGSDIGAFEVQCAGLSLGALPGGTAGVAYNQPLNPGGGFAPYTITQPGGTFPPGLTIVNGVLTGTPSATGAFSFTLQVTDAYGCTASRSYTVVFTCAGVTVIPASLPGGAVGTAYNQTVGTSPTGAFSFAVTSGALPTGLMLNAATGAITGTPAQSGSFSFTIMATGAECAGSRGYNIVIGCPTITLAALGNAMVGTNYAGSVAASPGGTYSYSLLMGSLPAGLTLNPTSGALTGIPAAAGTYSFTIKAQAASGCGGQQSYSLTIGCPAVTVNPASLPNPTAGAAYSQTVSAAPAGGNYSYTVSSGGLPAGLNLNAATGTISGTTTATGTFNFRITANGSAGCTGSRDYSVVIGGGSCPTITLADLPSGQPGQLYSNSVTATPAGNYSYAVTSGSLPPGLTLYGSFGLIYGYPNTAGTFSFTVTATDSNNCTGSKAYSLPIGGAATRSLVFGDFDGDGKADLSVWRGASGEWLTVNSGDGKLKTEAWGTSAAPYFDVMTPGDYDGDGKMDLAVFRKSTGEWFIKRSSDGAITTKLWGLGTDVPVPGDYDGDGQTDIAVWRGADTNWYIVRSSDGQTQTVSWGTSKAPYNDVPVPADFDGDGKTDVAVFRQANGHWYIRLSAGNEIVDKAWGLGTDVPVAADYDGDGKADIAVRRRADTNWYIIRSSDGTVQSLSLGSSALGEMPAPGDFDGDGKADAAIWRAKEGHWHILGSRDGKAFTQSHGTPGDLPVIMKAKP